MKSHVTIKPNRLQLTVEAFLKDYSAEVGVAVRVAVAEVAQESAEELRHAGSFKGRKYRPSWTYEVRQTSLFTDGTVFVKAPHYRLSHLLEFGHAKQNGGRTTAFNFIAPVNDKVEERFNKKLKDILGVSI